MHHQYSPQLYNQPLSNTAAQRTRILVAIATSNVGAGMRLRVSAPVAKKKYHTTSFSLKKKLYIFMTFRTNKLLIQKEREVVQFLCYLFLRIKV